MAGHEKADWKESYDREMGSREENGTWILVKKTELPTGANVLKSGIVFDKKLNANNEVDSYKTRVVCKGYAQVRGVDYLETHSPVPNQEAISTGLSVGVKMNLKTRHCDFSSAFLNAATPEGIEIYVELPDGYTPEGMVPGEACVLQLEKCLYGLKQAPREWNSLLDKWLVEKGFVPTPSDPCLYVRGKRQMRTTRF
jgi:hypothetical protein